MQTKLAKKKTQKIEINERLSFSLFTWVGGRSLSKVATVIINVKKMWKKIYKIVKIKCMHVGY